MCKKHMYQRLLWVNTSHFMFSLNMILESSNVLFVCFGVTQTLNRECAKPFCFLFRVFIILYDMKADIIGTR